MDTLFAYLRKLHDHELYEQVLPIVNILEARYDSDRSALNPDQYFLMLMYNANSLFHLKQYRRADAVYRVALVARRAIVKVKPPTALSISFENMVEMFPDYEIRYKIAQCLEVTSNIHEALAILNTLPNRQRTLKINMMIAKLSLQTGKFACAVNAYKQIVRESPVNLEAIKGLLALNVTDIEISGIIHQSCLPIQVTEWLNEWLDIHVSMRKCQFTMAIARLESLRSNSQFGRNELLTVLLGQCYYYNGDYDLALRHLERAHANNYYLLDGLSTLSSIYTIKEDAEELEKLTRLFMQTSEYTTEHWLLFGQYYFVLRKYEKATYFAHRACQLNPRNIEACLLKARILVETKKFKDAIIQLKLLVQFANHRFEVYDCLVTAYIGLQRWHDVHQLTADAFQILGNSPRIYVMLARPFLADPAAKKKAKPYLEKALKHDKYYAPAVLHLSELLVEDGNTSRALDLLKKLAEVRPSAEIFMRIGEIYTLRKERMKSYEYFTLAVKLDPSNEKATAHLEALEKQATNSPLVESTINQAGASTSSDLRNATQDAMEVQADAEGGERLPSIEEEAEAEGWVESVNVATQSGGLREAGDPNEQDGNDTVNG